MKKNFLLVMFICFIYFLGFSEVNSLNIKSNSPLYAFTNEGNRLRIIYRLRDDNADVFCMNSNKELPDVGDNLTFVRESSLSAGILYIIDNAKNLTMAPYSGNQYTNSQWAKITKDEIESNSSVADMFEEYEKEAVTNSTVTETEQYIKKQLAIWLLNEGKVDENGVSTSDRTNLVKSTYPGIANLVDTAKKQKDSELTEKIMFSGSTDLVLVGDNYETGLITVTSTNKSNIKLAVGFSSALIYLEDGSLYNESIKSGTKIKVVIPASALKDKHTSSYLSGNISETKRIVNIYKINDQKQELAKIENKPVVVNEKIDLKFVKNLVKISKTDITTGKELPGATLQIEDKDGKIVKYCKDSKGNRNVECKWVSTDKPYEIEELPVGTYYLVETMAPKGYVLNKEKIEFTIKEDTITEKVEMKNNLEVKVPDTLSSRSALLISIAMLDIALGIGILTYVRKQKNNIEN